MILKIYGIKNCDTMKKAFVWLDDHGIAYDFHDYKKSGADMAILQQAFAQHGWDSVINRNGLTWKKLPETVRSQMTESMALQIALENPSIIKRPLIVKGDQILLGSDYQNL